MRKRRGSCFRRMQCFQKFQIFEIKKLKISVGDWGIPNKQKRQMYIHMPCLQLTKWQVKFAGKYAGQEKWLHANYLIYEKYLQLNSSYDKVT